MTRARMSRLERPPLTALQVPPASVLLQTPPPLGPAATVVGAPGSMARPATVESTVRDHRLTRASVAIREPDKTDMRVGVMRAQLPPPSVLLKTPLKAVPR